MINYELTEAGKTLIHNYRSLESLGEWLEVLEALEDEDKEVEEATICVEHDLDKDEVCFKHVWKLKDHEMALTPEKLKEKFAQEGKTFADWARQHGYEPRDVYMVTNGLTKARRGKGYEIAKKLGLK